MIPVCEENMKDTRIKELQGANMDIDLVSENINWKQSGCPWNEADHRTDQLV